MDTETQTEINEKLRTIQSNEKKIKIAKKQITAIEEKIKKYTNQNNKLKEEVNNLVGESSLQMNLPWRLQITIWQSRTIDIVSIKNKEAKGEYSRTSWSEKLFQL